MNKDTRFEELRKGVYQELLKANQHFKIYWEIRLAPKEIARAKNVYLSFFYFTMWANNDRFCLAVCNVTKCDKDTANFQKLFNYIRSSKELSNNFDLNKIQLMESTIQSHQNLIDRISTIRDQYVAHNQLKKNHFGGEAAYTYEEGKKLLKDLNTTLNDLSHKYDNNTYGLDNDSLLKFIPSLEVRAVLRDLTNHYNDRIRRRRETTK